MLLFDVVQIEVPPIAEIYMKYSPTASDTECDYYLQGKMELFNLQSGS